MIELADSLLPIPLTCEQVPMAKKAVKNSAKKPAGKRPPYRLTEIGDEQMNALQRSLRDAIYAGPRGVRKKLTGPFQIWLNAPELGHLAQALGAHVRYKTSLSPRLSETATSPPGQTWKAQYEWHAHAPMAEKAGVKPKTVKEIQTGREPKSAAKDERAIIDFVRELYKTRRVSDRTYKRVHAFLGDGGMVELVGICGYYAMISMTLNVFRAQLPPEDSAAVRRTGLGSEHGPAPFPVASRQAQPAVSSPAPHTLQCEFVLQARTCFEMVNDQPTDAARAGGCCDRGNRKPYQVGAGHRGDERRGHGRRQPRGHHASR